MLLRTVVWVYILKCYFSCFLLVKSLFEGPLLFFSRRSVCRLVEVVKYEQVDLSLSRPYPILLRTTAGFLIDFLSDWGYFAGIGIHCLFLECFLDLGSLSGIKFITRSLRFLACFMFFEVGLLGHAKCNIFIKHLLLIN
jgi:hypothetical protein